MGLAWGASPPLGFAEGALLVILAFAIINLSSAIGAQANTLYDYELDLKDERKRQLVRAMDSFWRKRLKTALVVEFILAAVLVSVFMFIQGKPILLTMWVVGISLGYAYSAPPLRLKSRSWMAPVVLILVLAFLPVLFAYFTFASDLNLFFLLSLTGLAFTVYGVIVPTEIRDYFGDKAMGIETMTVRLGLVRASFLGIALLTAGAVFTGTAFMLEWIFASQPFLCLALLAIPVAVGFVLREFVRLRGLSKERESSENPKSVEERIVGLSARNPQWIMLVTQTYSAMSIILLISRFLV
jgi:4-hydroxybenzoate polyprenyltransferase